LPELRKLLKERGSGSADLQVRVQAFYFHQMESASADGRLASRTLSAAYKTGFRDDKKQQDLPAHLKVRPFKSIAGLLQLSVFLPWVAAWPVENREFSRFFLTWARFRK
jgi:hypothetical protein